MKKSIFLLLFCCLVVLTACHSSADKMPKEAVMTQLLQENPDSLAMILEEKINPETLSDSAKADYALWLTKTHVKQNRSLMNDTLIHYAADYYKKTNSPHLLETSILAAAQTNWSDAKRLEQEQMLNETMQIAMQQKDTTAVQDICFQLTKLYEMPEDSSKIAELIQITKRYAGTEWSVADYFKTVAQFSSFNRLDSIIFYAQKGIELAQKQNDSSNDFFEYQLRRTYANALSAMGKGAEAITVLRALEHSKLPVNHEIRLNYINAWVNWGKLDSAQVYINDFQSLLNENKNNIRPGEIIEFENVKLLLGAYQDIIWAKEGKFVSMNEIGIPTENIFRNIRNRMKINREQQFVQTQLIRKNLTLEIEREKLKQYFLWAGIVVLLAVIFIIYRYQRKLLSKERSVREAKEQLRLHTLQLSENESTIRENEELINSLSGLLDESGDLKQEIAQLNETNEALKEKNKTLQQEREYYAKEMGQKDADFDVFEKLAEEYAKLQERERFLTAQLIARTETLDRLNKKPRYLEKSQWNEIIHAVNQLFDGYSYRLHANFPALTEEDIFYCCLFKLRLSTSTIGTLMGISPSSVTKRKQRIKEKMIRQYPDENQYEKLLEIYSWN